MSQKKPKFWKWLYLMLKEMIGDIPRIILNPIFEMIVGLMLSMFFFFASGVFLPLLFVSFGFLLVGLHGVYRDVWSDYE